MNATVVAPSRAVFTRRFLIAVLAVACLCLPVAAVSAADIVFGGETDLAAGVRGDAALPDISPFARLSFLPELAVFADTAELRASGSIALRYPAGYTAAATGGIDAATAGLSFSLDTLHLRLYPLDWLVVDAGLQRHTPGAGLLISPVDYLSPLTLDFGSGGELPSTAGPAALVGATAFIGSAFVSAFVAPAPSEIVIPEVDQDILARIPVLESINDPDVSATSLTRTSFEILDTRAVDEGWRRASAEINVGLPLGPLDLTALYYHGLDRIPTVTATATTTAGDFALSAAAAESVIDALGVSAQTTLGPAMLWADGSFVFDRAFGSTRLVPSSGTTAGDPGIYVTETVTAPHLELVAGGLVQLEVPRLTIATEYRHGFIGSDREDLIRLDFPGTALLSLGAEWLDGLVTTTASGIILLAPGAQGAVVVGSVNVTPSSELSAYLQAPVVLAAPGSLLGGLRSTVSVTAGFRYRF